LRYSRPPSSPPPSNAFAGVDGLADDLAQQRALVGDSNKIYQQLLIELDAVLCGPNANGAIVDRLDRAWRERRFTAFYERPLVLLASLRTDAISTGEKHPLAAALARDDSPDVAAVTRANVLEAMSPDRLALWLMIATRRIQTNEVGRAVAWRWPAALAACHDGARPIALVDVGSSGGLNLIADRVPEDWVDLNGALLPVVRKPKVVSRIGFDTQPLDFHNDEDVHWARSCIWPGELARLQRFDNAIKAFRSLGPDDAPVTLHRLNATLVPARLPEILRSIPGEAVLLIMQTLVRAYMDSERRDAYTRAMRNWIAATPRGRVAWIELELEPGVPGEMPATITAHIPDGDGGVADIVLARCSYHPREIDVRPGAAQFQRAMAWR
jgi:hypothetical protein